MAKTAKKVQAQSLESIMWNCRNALRGTVGGNEKNRDAVMGLVFLKFAGDKFEKRRAEIKTKHGDIPEFVCEDDSFYLSENVYYINETARWSYIVTNASKNDIAVILDKAMADIEDKNPPLKGALPQNFYAALGTRKEQIKGLIDEINKGYNTAGQALYPAPAAPSSAEPRGIKPFGSSLARSCPCKHGRDLAPFVNKIDESHFKDKDLIGRVYEYFLQVFAIDAGQGEKANSTRRPE